MKKNLAVILLFIFFGNTTNLKAQCAHTVVKYLNSGNVDCITPYKLIFQDEFNGESLDTNKWRSYNPDANGTDQYQESRTNAGNQVYLDKNCVVSGGKLELQAIEEPATWFGASRNYTSGMLNSKPVFKFGRFEIRCKIPQGDGFVPAFWLYNHDEIDVFEFCSCQPTKQYVTLHNDCGGSTKSMSGISKTISDASTGFHTYAVEWEPYYVKWYTDGQLIRKVLRYSKIQNSTQYLDCGTSYNSDYYYSNDHVPEDHWMPILVNLYVTWFTKLFPDCQQPSASTNFPANFEVDYIRAWQRNMETRFTDLCAIRKFVGDDIICNNEIKTFKVEGGYGNLMWNTSSNLEITETGSNYIKVKIKNGANAEAGEIYLTETNSPCGSNYNITHKIYLGLPKIVSVSKHVGGCGDPIILQTELVSIPQEISSFPTVSANIDSSPSTFYMRYGNHSAVLSGWWSLYNAPINDYCYPVEIIATNNCGADIYNSHVKDNCNASGPCGDVNLNDNISNLPVANMVTISPNPSQDGFDIKFEDEIDFFVQNCHIVNAINSNEVLHIPSVNMFSSTHVNCSNWIPGVYILHFTLENGEQFHKTFLKN